MSLDPTKLELGPANVYLKEGGVDVHLGFLGDDVAVNMSTSVSPLTGAQTGTAAQDEIVNGGSFQIVVPFKEISLANFSRAYPNSALVGTEGGLQRVDFKLRVGLSLRSLAKQMTLKKLVGGVESVLPKDWIVIPECSPSASDVSIPFHPTNQRVIAATFRAWPNATTGRWAYAGDELAS